MESVARFLHAATLSEVRSVDSHGVHKA
jgi:hypothetical protein